jgi:hypothetical protein
LLQHVSSAVSSFPSSQLLFGESLSIGSSTDSLKACLMLSQQTVPSGAFVRPFVSPLTLLRRAGTWSDGPCIEWHA